MKEKVYSIATGQEYCPVDVVRILNVKQATLYIANGAQLLDIYASKDFRTNEPVLVFIFNRLATLPLYDAWCKRTLTMEEDDE